MATPSVGQIRLLDADDVVDDWGREFRGPDAIRGWSDREFIGGQVSLETGVEQEGGATTVTTTVGGRASTARATSRACSMATALPG
jgi:hypothetical protein